MWVDPKIKEFNGRIARIHKARAKGYGFEAAGTLGRSFYTRPRRRNLSLMKPLLVTLMVAVTAKALIHWNLGPDTYQARVDSLQQGEGFDRLGGWLMAADPMTLAISGFLTRSLSAE